MANAFVPSTRTPWNPTFNFALQQVGGGLLMLAVLDIFLLRYTNDIRIWRILEAAVSVYGVTLLYSNYSALQQQGRLSFGALRGEDWSGIAVSAQAAVVRAAFVMGVGLSRRGKSRGKRV